MRMVLLSLALSILPLSACTLQDGRGDRMPSSLETQKQAVIREGVVLPKEINIYENGTHYLVTEAGERYLLKSQVVDLSRHEEESVRVTGEMVDDPAEAEIPVITVYTLDRSRPDAAERKSVFTEAEFGFTASLPGDWQRSATSEDVVEYFPSDSDPAIRISRIEPLTQEASQIREEMLTATPVTIDGRNAKRILESDGGVRVSIPPVDGSDLILVEFIPTNNPEVAKAAFYEMLSGLEWISRSDREEVEASPNNAGAIVCGGSAKKLCPAGYRCELESFEPNAVGTCVDATLAPDAISRVLDQKKADEVLGTENERTEPLTESISEPTDWTRYERERFEYSFAIPSSWWWSEIPDENSVSTVAIAQEKVTDDNVIINLEIVPGSITGKKEGRYADSLELSIPRDDDSHFVISGDIAFAEQIRGIAASLSSL